MNTLNLNNDLFIKILTLEYHLPFSVDFMNIAEKQLFIFFEKNTGLKINKHIGCSAYRDYMDNTVYYDIITKFQMRIGINTMGETITMCWKSKSGKIYKISDINIDENDIEFSFEGLDPVLYHNYMFPKINLPFKFKDLPFELVIERLNMDCTIKLHFKNIESALENEVLEVIDTFLQKMVDKGVGGGVAHNFKKKKEGNIWIYEIDLGSIGVVFIKKLINLFAKINIFTKVEIC